jgi:hypothetical protein
MQLVESTTVKKLQCMFAVPKIHVTGFVIKEILYLEYMSFYCLSSAEALPEESN